MKVDIEAAKKAMLPIAMSAAVSVEDAALGVIQLSDAKKVNMIKLISVQRGCPFPSFYSYFCLELILVIVVLFVMEEAVPCMRLLWHVSYGAKR